MTGTLPYVVRFPDDAGSLALEEEYFYVQLEGREQKIRLHDYARIYRHPGLYEHVVTDKLQCRSPWVVSDLLAGELDRSGVGLSTLKVLDFGAGCGIAGEILHERGVRSIVGLDMLAEAGKAAQRDRPGVYGTYVVGDICRLEPKTWTDLEPYPFNTLISVSALASGHIASDAFAAAFNLITDGGWIAFNVLHEAADGCSDADRYRFRQQVIGSGCMQVKAERIYNHRLLMNGRWIENVAVVGQKRRNISVRTPSTYR